MDFVDYTLLVLSTMHDDHAVDIPLDGDIECRCANYIAQAYSDNASFTDAAAIAASMVLRATTSIINPNKENPL